MHTSGLQDEKEEEGKEEGGTSRMRTKRGGVQGGKDKDNPHNQIS